MLLPDRGSVSLLGGPPDTARQARVGWVPEVRALPDDARVHDTLVLFGRIRGATRHDARTEASGWLEKLEIAEKARHAIRTLSNGQQQKVQIALALMGRPELLVLDEPLTALDPTHQDRVLGLVRQAARDGATVLLATHRLWEAEAFVDHVVLLAAGQKRLDAPLLEALRASAANVWGLVVRDEGPLDWVHGPEVLDVERTPSGQIRVRLVEGADPAGLVRRSVEADVGLTALEAVLPSLQELFLATVR